MMLNVSALITGYESVGDHTEFIVQVCHLFSYFLLSLWLLYPPHLLGGSSICLRTMRTT